MPQEFSVGVVVYRGAEFLLLHYASGHWGFVKGNIEKNESAEDTARRELQEETGITSAFFVKDFTEKEEYFYKKEGKTVHKEVVYLLAETQEKLVKLSDEHIGYKWLPFEEAMHVLTFSQSKDILKKAHDYLKNH